MHEPVVVGAVDCKLPRVEPVIVSPSCSSLPILRCTGILPCTKGDRRRPGRTMLVMTATNTIIVAAQSS